MWKWTNHRSYNSSSVSASDQQVVNSPEQFNMPLEEKVNAIARVVGEMAEQLSVLSSLDPHRINNIDNNVNGIRYDVQNIANQMNTVSHATDVMARTPYNIDGINNSVNDIKNILSQSSLPENAELVNTVKILLQLSKSDQLKDLYKVMRILTEK